MGFWLFLFLVVLILGGGWFYRRLLDIEKEIRTEMAEEEALAEPPQESPPAEPELVQSPPPATGKMAPQARVLEFVAETPGLLQTELYGRMPEMSRRNLQQLLRRMEDEGLLRREKERGSYRLYPG